jgi:hypothetical protein
MSSPPSSPIVYFPDSTGPDLRGGHFSNVSGNQTNLFHQSNLHGTESHFAIFIVYSLTFRGNIPQISTNHSLLSMMLRTTVVDLWPNAFAALARMSSARLCNALRPAIVPFVGLMGLQGLGNRVYLFTRAQRVLATVSRKRLVRSPLQGNPCHVYYCTYYICP